MSNPYTFHIGNLMVVVYAPTRAEATRIFDDSMRKNDSKVVDDFVELFKSKTNMENALIDKLAKEFKEQNNESK